MAARSYRSADKNLIIDIVIGRVECRSAHKELPDKLTRTWPGHNESCFLTGAYGAPISKPRRIPRMPAHGAVLMKCRPRSLAANLLLDTLRYSRVY
ncbi:hypothetical protein CDAR_602441 [Caerostris darwini]|uniref:Uncharacterized protein n=1 Tax=Caerostris darwini TaxID=1538125 RepID=A0AAV4MID0_9ARAC|nr:hypothetical protein CDAR_602441 [Caerostris darwini]